MAGGRVGDLAAAVGDPAFLDRCAKSYTASGFGVASAAEQRSWRNSWPALFAALLRAGLSDLQIYLEYATPGGGRRLDALLVGAAPRGMLGLVIVELKQWQTCRILDAERVMRQDGLVTAHPVHQVAAYRSFFEHWRPQSAPALDTRAVVLLHNAAAAEGSALSASAGTSHGVPVLTGTDLAAPAPQLAGRLRCDDLKAPGSSQVQEFENIRWEPSGRLLDHVSSLLEGHSTFALVGAQQDAFVRIRAAAARHLPDRNGSTAQDSAGAGAVITVSGGPGSGKTALAVRLLGHLMRAHPLTRPRFLTPSGTLRAHLLDATKSHSAARELFPPAGAMGSVARQTGALIIDEAQRARRTPDRSLPPELAAVIEHVPLAVIFLDERQVIRPHEGTTVEEIRTTAQTLGRTHHHLELTGSFRCGASAAYTAWVDALLYGTPHAWDRTGEYDLTVTDDPFALQEWIEQATCDGHTARTAAGFCWRWARSRARGATTLPLDIHIDLPQTSHTPARTWRAAWNAADTLTAPDGAQLAPHSQLWATHTGGHQQIGCIYTAQGLEYHHAGVIIGPDLTWRDNRWHADPSQSHDPQLRPLPHDQYLRYALNTYRVLLTRGTHATRITSTDPATHHMLSRLLPPPHHTRDTKD
ncbi:DNA/RNA helicase domain-containing protein [Streptomyces sp. NPDC092046]|uniref:DNA/RNA helicase domain-containing protein n=1 Tax=Streptomyces sp. NPDC092046 TaxID=3366009 RepID=UPI0038131156